MIISFNDDSFSRHKISHREALEVIRNPSTKSFSLQDSKEGNDCEMYVGFTDSGCLLEIGVEYLDDSDHCFHGQVVSPKFRKLFEEDLWES